MVNYSALLGLYELHKTIGCGGFAKVKLATHLATGERVAIKIMDKKMLGDDLHRVTLEVEALKCFQHDNICQLYQVLETDTHYYLVMEYCSGGELFDHIVEKSRLTETESRNYFRQIVSAVAYLHNQGFAHRDLKPENMLLDSKQNVKLIDFGLCAKPLGGMQNPLFTSCGSPTYAAPELIQGQEYLGQEVDVWAMGVLLYALLTGSLPFDDVDIGHLYKKIMNGKYLEPRYISKESKSLIKSMLQIDGKQRVRIKDLLNHPWMTLNGVLEPINFPTKNEYSLNEDCVKAMAVFHNVDESVMKLELGKRKFDYNLATYFLLLKRTRSARSLRLQPAPGWKSTFITPKKSLNRRRLAHVRSPEFVEPANRKAQKRARSPRHDENSPVPTKRPIVHTPQQQNTPDRKKLAVILDNTPGSSTPGSASRKMLGNLEKSFNKVKHMLTPKRDLLDLSQKPTILNSKDLCNVSTTQSTDPELVINELAKGLEQKGMKFVKKGFILKGSFEPTTTSQLGACSFELEVCFLPESFGIISEGENHKFRVGIRRKRLRGDSWCYKRVCEQILALTSTEFERTEQFRESRI